MTLVAIFQEAVEASHPARVLPQALQNIEGDNLHLVALGKAGESMALSALQALQGRIRGGVVVGKHPAQLPPPFEYLRGGHPIPDARSEAAGRRLQSYLRDLPEGATVIVLLSGGASSLAEIPKEGVSLAEIIDLNRHLMSSGLPIEEMNRQRGQLSDLKWGGLNRWLPPGTTTLVISDVIDSPPEFVGSGPTAGGGPLEVVADCQTLLQAALQAARRRGLPARVYSGALRGEARQVAKDLANLEQPGLWLAVGETSVTVSGSGRGGRCQELALAFALEAQLKSPRLLLAAASDGEDGEGIEVAGAWSDATTVARARALGLDAAAYLQDNDSHAFFAKIGQHVQVGPTGTNVNDLMILYRQ
ncbi:DUF4147 domain-containing protein [bacterium]|nr:DUF4147 domain-containing protein [bacterium]